MNPRIAALAVVSAAALGTLMYSATSVTAKEIVTVEKLVATHKSERNVRLGARVANREIQYETSPEFLLRFNVRDIASEEDSIPVVYRGIMPDTLKIGRDVILEGDFVDGQFVATNLMTQCPSKYEPPQPGAAETKSAY